MLYLITFRISLMRKQSSIGILSSIWRNISNTTRPTRKSLSTARLKTQISFARNKWSWICWKIPKMRRNMIKTICWCSLRCTTLFLGSFSCWKNYKWGKNSWTSTSLSKTMIKSSSFVKKMEKRNRISGMESFSNERIQALKYFSKSENESVDRIMEVL